MYPCSGVEHGNLRELALARMKDFGTECRDVRTREVDQHLFNQFICIFFNIFLSPSNMLKTHSDI